MGEIRVRSRLAGSFNLMNILAAVASAVRLGIPADSIMEGIEAVRVVPGRLERVPSDRGSIFVDYAHTPQALEIVLEAIRELQQGRIITLMGCGGDRDKTKRPIMGRAAAQGSDFVIVTSDNPRTEDSGSIIAQILEGVAEAGCRPLGTHVSGGPLEPGCYRVIPDRRQAIAWAVRNIQEDDILLVAGKGHEAYQEINGIRYPFDDREVVREELRAASGLNPRSYGSGGHTPDAGSPKRCGSCRQ
jgi:UDP-N-acetylmuramoyl-L-alanyl-D-glutamate--2,6-diaminopimelate ligase